MATCNWQPAGYESRFFGRGYECREAPWKDGDVCIFHAPRGNKTRKEIEEAVLSKTAREENDENAGFHDFRGYVFPTNFSAFAATSTEKGKEFRKRVDFTCAEFGKKVDFRGATFGNKARFAGATFGKKMDFSHATFGDEAFFLNAKFENEASFFRATFAGIIVARPHE